MRPTRLLVASLLAVSTACAPDAPLASDGQLPTPGALSLTVPTLVAGATSTLSVTGAVPGEQVFFGLSLNGAVANGLCPSGFADCLNLANPPILAGVRVADANGDALLSITPPSNTAGRSLFLQAASRTHTSAVSHTFIQAPQPPMPSTGEVTSYDYQGDGFCGLDVPFGTPPWVYTIAAPPGVYQGASLCGVFVELSSVGATDTFGNPACSDNTTIQAMIVDSCPTCTSTPAAFDLNLAAFDALGDPLCGRLVDVSWQYIERPDNADLRVRVDAGTNPFFVLLHVLQHRYAIVDVEVRDAVGNTTWTAGTRQADNAWQFSPPAPPFSLPLDVRFTDVHGNVVVAPALVTSFTGGDLFDVNQQFPAGLGSGLVQP